MPGYTVIGTLKSHGSILDIKTLDKEIAIFDSAYCLLRADKTTLRPTAKGVIQKGAEPMYAYSKSAAIFKNADMLMSVSGGSKAYMLSMKDGALSKKGVFEYFRGALMVSAFSSRGELCMCGSESGELALFDAKRLIPMGSFDKQGDYVSQISFCDKDRFCAVSYYDKKTIIYDILEMCIACVFTSEAIIEKAVFAKKIGAFVGVSRSGTLEAVCATRKKTIFSNKPADFWATDIALLGENTIAISSREGRLFFFDLEEQELLKEIRPMENIGISKLHVSDGRLFVGFCTGDVFAIDIDAHKDEFVSYAKLGDFIASEALCEKNFFLAFDSEYKTSLKKAWETKKNEIAYLLVKQKHQDAFIISKPFLRIKSIREEFESILSQIVGVAEFFDALEANKYAEAYKIASQSEIIRKLDAYQKLENIFEESLKRAVGMLEEDEIQNKTAVLTLLKPFAAVPSKKATVVDLIKNWGKYKESLAFLKNRSFKEVFAFAARYPFLKETGVYKKTVALGDGLLQKITVLENDGEYQKLLEVSKLLLDFEPFATVASSKAQEYTAKIKALEMINSYKERKVSLKNIANTINKNEILDDFDALDAFLLFLQEEIMGMHTQYGHLPVEFWSRAKEYAYISKLKNFTLTLLRESYIAELKMMETREPQNIDWGRSFEKLAAYFEIDAKTESFAKNMGVKLTVKERAKDINIDILPSSVLF